MTKVSLKSSESVDRLESVKSAVVSTAAGSLAYLPVGIAFGLYEGFSPAWEFHSDTLAVTLFLFGVVYRYTVRSDTENQMLKMGVIGAFSVSRSLDLITLSDSCTSIPLFCGPPFGYFDFRMIFSGLEHFLESYVAFNAAAGALDACFIKGLISTKSAS